MTDKEKLGAIRTEIHRLVDVRGYDREMANDLFAFMDSLPNEPVSEDLEKVVEEIVEPTILNAYGTKELARRLRNTICGTSVSEDLEQAIDTYLATYFGGEKEKQEWPFLKKMAIHFAQWQKAQMMKDATEVTVRIEAGNYPYIPQLELYDYDKDIPLAKEGDKYKVVLIKEG